MNLPVHHPFRSPAARDRFLAHYEARAAHWPVPSETRVVETAFGATFVRVSGPPTAPPLVLLHGVSSNSLTWSANIEALSSRFRTFAVDNVYDCGRSVYTRQPRTADDFVAWLDELFTRLELDAGIHLLGLSYGGWLTVQYAMRHPERLSRIVLLAPVGTVMPISFGWIVRAVLSAIPHRSFTRRFMRWMLRDLAESGEAGSRQLEALVDDAFLALRSFKPRRLVPPTVLSDAEWQSIQVPALFLVGEHETLYDGRKAIERLARVAPQIHTELIPGAGHDLTLVQAERVNRAVLEFLTESP